MHTKSKENETRQHTRITNKKHTKQQQLKKSQIHVKTIQRRDKNDKREEKTIDNKP